MRKTITLFTAVAALAVAPLPTLAQKQPTLTFTAIPDQDETKLVQRFTAFGKHLESKLGVPVKYVPVKNYAASVTAFRNGQVQLGWFGGLSGVQARLSVPGSEAVAQGVEDPSFKSYFIANTATGLVPAERLTTALEGKTFTFGSRDSTSGRLFPEHFLRRAFGKAPEQIFSRVGFSGDHNRTIRLVQSGAFQVGVVNYLVWESELEAGRIDRSKVQVIWSTPGYPDYNWSVRGDVDAVFGTGFKDKLQAAILGVEDGKLLGHFGRSKFIPAKNSDYRPIEKVGKLTGLVN